MNKYQYGGAGNLKMSELYKELTEQTTAKDSLRAVATKLNEFMGETDNLTQDSAAAVVKILKSNNLLMMNIKLLDILVSQGDRIALSTRGSTLIRNFPNNALDCLTANPPKFGGDAERNDRYALLTTVTDPDRDGSYLTLAKKELRHRLARGERDICGPPMKPGNIYSDPPNTSAIDLDWLFKPLDLDPRVGAGIVATAGDIRNIKNVSDILMKLFDNAKNSTGGAGVMVGFDNRGAGTGLTADRYIELIGILNDLRGFVLLYNLIVDLKDAGTDTELLKRINEMVIPPTTFAGVYAIGDVNEKLYRHCFYEQVDLFVSDYVTKKSAGTARQRNAYIVSEHFDEMYNNWDNGTLPATHPGIITKVALWELILNAADPTAARVPVVKALLNISDADPAAWTNKIGTIYAPNAVKENFIEEIFTNFKCSDSAVHKMLFLFLFSFGQKARMTDVEITLGPAVPAEPDQLTAYQLIHFGPMFEKLKLELDDRMKIADAVFKADETRKSDEITRCLSSIGQSYGAGSSGVPASTQAVALQAVQNNLKTGQTLTDEKNELLLATVKNESSGEVPVPQGMETLDILNSTYEEYINFTSISTDESSYAIIEPFVNSINKALYDAHNADVIVLKNPKEVAKIVKNDPTFKNGFSNRGTSRRLREYNKESRHITIQLKNDANDYDSLPGEKDMYDEFKLEDPNFERLSKFTLQLFGEIGENPTNIRDYFQNLGDTSVKKTAASFEITYIVESQYSMLNPAKIKRTKKLVERIRDAMRRKPTVELRDFGGAYNIYVLDREHAFWAPTGTGKNVITKSQKTGDEIIWVPDATVWKERSGSATVPGSASSTADFVSYLNQRAPLPHAAWYFGADSDDGLISPFCIGTDLGIFKACTIEAPCFLEKINETPVRNREAVAWNRVLEGISSVHTRINVLAPPRFTFSHSGASQAGGSPHWHDTVLSRPHSNPLTEVPTEPKMNDTWSDITVSSEQKDIVRNLSEYTINSRFERVPAAAKLIQKNKQLQKSMRIMRAKMFGVKDTPEGNDPSSNSTEQNTDSENVKKLKAELEAQKQAQATAIATQNTQALAAAQRQATQLQSQINQQTRQNQNTGRPNQNTGQPNQNTGRPNQNTGQSNIRPAQQGPSSAQSNIRSSQQGPSSAQSNIRSSQQPGKEVGQRSGVQPGENPSQPGEKPEQGPSFIERLLGSSGDIDKQKEELKTEKDDLEKQKEEEIKMKDQMAKAEAVQKKAEIAEKEEDIPANLFKQLYDKSSPEYVKVKEMMIAQIKLIHKYNLLKQESFGLMLDNSKYGTLEEENTRQKELIRDLENKIFNIIQQILGAKGSNKGSNKLNKDLLSYINDLKSSDSDGSLVDTSKYLELINTANNSSKNKTLKKYKHKQPVNSKKKKSIAKRNNTKKTPMKYIKKRTPKKSKFIGAKKGRRTPIKPKNI